MNKLSNIHKLTFVLFGVNNNVQTYLMSQSLQVQKRYQWDVFHYETQVGSEEVELELWNAFGQERFMSIVENRANQIRQAKNSAFIFVYDANVRESFNLIKKMHRRLRKKGDQASMILVGIKSDSKERNQVSASEALEFSQLEEMAFIEVSTQREMFHIFERSALLHLKRLGFCSNQVRLEILRAEGELEKYKSRLLDQFVNFKNERRQTFNKIYQQFADLLKLEEEIVLSKRWQTEELKKHRAIMAKAKELELLKELVQAQLAEQNQRAAYFCKINGALQKIFLQQEWSMFNETSQEKRFKEKVQEVAILIKKAIEWREVFLQTLKFKMLDQKEKRISNSRSFLEQNESLRRKIEEEKILQQKQVFPHFHNLTVLCQQFSRCMDKLRQEVVICNREEGESLQGTIWKLIQNYLSFEASESEQMPKMQPNSDKPLSPDLMAVLLQEKGYFKNLTKTQQQIVSALQESINKQQVNIGLQMSILEYWIQTLGVDH